MASNSLFCGNLAWTVTTEQLAEFMASAGELVSCEVQVHDNRSKGFGLVTFATTEEAENAINTLNGADLFGRPVNVRMDRGPKQSTGPRNNRQQFAGEVDPNNPTIYVGNLSWSATSDDLTAVMAQAGNLVSCEVQLRPDTGRSKGWALVTYSTPAEAQHAISTLDGADVCGRNVQVREDRGKGAPRRGGGGGGGRNRAAEEFILYVHNVAAGVSWRELKNLFQGYGAQYTDVKYDEDGTPYGQVNFATIEEAQNAQANCNGTMLNGLPMHLQL
jgi:nucleolin